MGALIAHRENDHWIVDALGAPHVGERSELVGIYSFEATGNGTYDLQAGLEYGKPGQRAVSTALGYNQ
jgi:hypothetical protein